MYLNQSMEAFAFFFLTHKSFYIILCINTQRRLKWNIQQISDSMLIENVLTLAMVSAH